jgi:hypothetical protein
LVRRKCRFYRRTKSSFAAARILQTASLLPGDSRDSTTTPSGTKSLHAERLFDSSNVSGAKIQRFRQPSLAAKNAGLEK